ncbi:MAG: uroporphyrinogen-III synthase [Paracoccus sp. (in: a-proteobacteria)]|jgi:uroporphyrinogen-III synthase|uniref:uroporphyrinogen-III synthase n=1 Tax=Paracoccus sp. TaxID=267 RepID=UPI0032D8EBE0
MPPAPRPILLMTRPGDDSERTAARIGADVIVAPILQIVPVDHDGAALAQVPGLVFTSAHAVASAGPGRGRPAICVGERTGQVARDAGFAVIQGAGTADSLVPLIAASPVPLVHPHGRHLAQRLAVPGVVVYDQQPQPLTARARAALMGARPVVVPVYSPRSARLLAGMAAGARAPLWLVAISDAAAAAWTAPAARRAVADQPSGRAMDAAIRAMLAAEQS